MEKVSMPCFSLRKYEYEAFPYKKEAGGGFLERLSIHMDHAISHGFWGQM
jgi:hypothetical protein